MSLPNYHFNRARGLSSLSRVSPFSAQVVGLSGLGAAAAGEWYETMNWGEIGKGAADLVKAVATATGNSYTPPSQSTPPPTYTATQVAPVVLPQAAPAKDNTLVFVAIGGVAILGLIAVLALK